MNTPSTNDTSKADSVATVAINGGVWSASYRDDRSTLRSRPRIADDQIALAAAGELLNRGCVLELHPEDVMAALGAGLRLAQADRHRDT